MKKEGTILLVTGVMLIGVLFLVLAYSMIWQPCLIETLIQYAAAAGFACFGAVLLYSCFCFFIGLRRKE